MNTAYSQGMDDVIHIVYASDDGFCRHMAASMQSVIFCHGKDPLHFHVLSDGISGESRRKLRSMAEGAGKGISFYPLDGFNDELQRRTGGFDTGKFRATTLARLMLGSVLPSDVRRVLYLDADTVVLRSLRGLFRLPLRGDAAAMAPEPTIYPAVRRIVGLLPEEPYFNAGVILADLSLWRKEGLEEAFFSWYREKGGRLPFNDQDILNHVLRGRVRCLPQQYNFISNYYYFSYGALCGLSPWYRDCLYQYHSTNSAGRFSQKCRDFFPAGRMGKGKNARLLADGRCRQRDNAVAGGKAGSFAASRIRQRDDAVARVHAGLLADGRCRKRDNAVAGGKAVFRRAKKHPVIVHFAGDERPWYRGNRNPYRAAYWKHLHRSAFSEERPIAGKELYMQLYHGMNVMTLICPSLRKLISGMFFSRAYPEYSDASPGLSDAEPGSSDASLGLSCADLGSSDFSLQSTEILRDISKRSLRTPKGSRGHAVADVGKRPETGRPPFPGGKSEEGGSFVAAVILNYNDADGTLAQAERISDYGALDSVVLVDNCSTDDSAARLSSFAAKRPGRVFFVPSGRNGGYGAGNNLGARFSFERLHADYVLIANPDAAFSEQCVKEMKRVFSLYPSVGAVSAVLKDGSGGVQSTAWPLRPWLFELLNSGPACRRIFRWAIDYPPSYFRRGNGKAGIMKMMKIMTPPDKDRRPGRQKAQVMETKEKMSSSDKALPLGRQKAQAMETKETIVPPAGAFVDVLHGSMLMLSREAFERSGGYDEGVFLYSEENILARRLKEAGFRSFLLTDQSYNHVNSGTISRTYRRMAERQRLRNQSELYYFRNYLHVPKAGMAFIRLFQAVVMIETIGAETLVQHLRPVKK